MTPKERADELLSNIHKACFTTSWYANVRAAILCVDEIIKARPTELITDRVSINNTNYWQQVKEELQKM